MKAFFQEWVYENGSYKIVALFITLILWVSVLGRKETTVVKEVPLQFISAEEQIVTNISSTVARFELTGSRRALRRFMLDRSDSISVDLKNRNPGRLVISIPDDSLKLPFGVKVLSVNPASVVVSLEETVRKKVPVIVTWKEATENNRVILKSVVDPAEVWVEGARTAIGKVREVLTFEVSSKEATIVGGQNEIKTKLRPLEIEGVKPLPDQEVRITF